MNDMYFSKEVKDFVKNVTNNPQLSTILTQYFFSQKLKQVKRQGWLDHGIKPIQCESVADHSFGTIYLATLLAEFIQPKLNYQKITLLSMIHDLAEAKIGDITPNEGQRYHLKEIAELSFFKEFFPKSTNNKIHSNLFEEFFKQNTPESQYIKFIDKLEMRLQAIYYQHMNPDLDLSDFFVPLEFYSSFKLIEIDPTLINLLEEFKEKLR